LTNPSLGGGQTSPTGGGGQVGMLLLSKYVKAGSNDTLDYFNHFAFLGSLEKLLGLGRLGYAKDSSLTLFTGGVFNAQL
jgi:hypothetical protein